MKKVILLFVLLMSIGSFAQSQIDVAKIDEIIQNYFSKSTVKGIEVSITNQNETFFNKGYGENLGNSITSDTPLFIGSTSKVITGLAIAILKDQGKLQFNDLAVNYLPEWESVLKDITIKDLLHHHSGISQESGYKNALEYKGDLNGVGFSVNKGEKGIYSSTNIAILGEIIEAISRKSYANFVEEEIFKPLQMVNSLVPLKDDYKNYKGYTFAYGKTIETSQMKYGNYIIPAGYIISTSDDLSKFNRLFLNYGKVDGKVFLDSLTVKEIFTPYDGSKETGFGMTWGIGKKGNSKVYGHEGMTKISNAKITILPEQNLAISIVANTNSGPFYSITSEISDAIVTQIQSGTSEKPFPKELLIRILFGMLTLKVLVESIRAFLKWKKLGSPKKLPKFNFKIFRMVLFTLIPLIILLAIPKMVHVPLSMFLRIMPDLGFALLIGGVLSLPLVYLKLANYKMKQD